ncbi:MAG: hypothetical protein ABJA66_09055 [Actinomycetota bacterium]
MRVEFQKTGERRYAVIVLRNGLPNLEMDPAPGFDPLMPHDLLHFLVEQELELRKGIFGQIAVGGTAVTFHNKPSEKSNNRADSRLRRKETKRGEKLLKTGLDDCAQSERATYISLYEWLSQSSEAKLRARGVEMKMNADSILAQMSETERATLKTKLAAITAKMDELSGRWAGLRVNQSMTLEWLLK